MKSRILLATTLAALALVPACTHILRVPLTGRDHPSGWSDQVREVAGKTYQYAQMANNAYRDARPFELPAELTARPPHQNDGIGFAYTVFERRRAGQVIEIIIAYRGTEWHLDDFWYGNLLGLQNRRGLEVYDLWRAYADAHYGREVPISVTGHSLGGGIATYVSLCRPNVASYVFNSSPRFRACARRVDNWRYSVVEHGEPLKAFRMLGREPTQTYISIGCTNRAGPGRQHSIRRLAECLTAIAAWDGAQQGAKR